MPRNVRNFWIEASVDGRESKLSGGPVRKDGGFSLTIFVRDDGDVTRALEIDGLCTSEGKLILRVTPKLGPDYIGDGCLEITTTR